MENLTVPAEEPPRPRYYHVRESDVPERLAWSDPVRLTDREDYEWGAPADDGAPAPGEGSPWVRRTYWINDTSSITNYLRRADPPGPEPSPGQVDTFLREGRIGPALLAGYNACAGTEHALADCRFSVEPGDGRRFTRDSAKVVMEVAGKRTATTIGQLYLVLGHPREITNDESRFFASCNIGWDSGTTGFELPRRPPAPGNRARHRPGRPQDRSLG